MALLWVDHRSAPGAWAAALDCSVEAVELLLDSHFIDLHVDRTATAMQHVDFPALLAAKQTRLRQWSRWALAVCGLWAVVLKVKNMDEMIKKFEAKGLKVAGDVTVGTMREVAFHPKDSYGVELVLAEYPEKHGATVAALSHGD